MKKCNGCEETKPVTEFLVCKSLKSVYRAKCKKCFRDYANKYKTIQDAVDGDLINRMKLIDSVWRVQ